MSELGEKNDHPLSQIDIVNILFPPPPYSCHVRRTNPDILELTNPIYQEDYEQLVSKNGTKLPVYQRTIGEYDDYEVETLSYDEWILLRQSPVDLIEVLESNISKSSSDEKAVGIHHHTSMFGDWYLPDLFQKVDLPKLQAERPIFDLEKEQS